MGMERRGTAMVALGLAWCCGGCAPAARDEAGRAGAQTVSSRAPVEVGRALTVDLWRQESGPVFRRHHKRLLRPGAVHPSVAKRSRRWRARAEAIGQWQAQGSPEALLELGRRYYPELAPPRAHPGQPVLASPDKEPNAAGLADPEAQLQLLPPARGDGALTLVTRGLRFVVEPVQAGAGTADAAVAPTSPAAGVWAYGTHRYLELMAARRGAPGEGSDDQRGEGAWRGQRVEDFVVVERPEGSYQARYRLHLPPGIRGVRDAGAYLELSDGITWAPVLRLHRPEARDADGQGRLGRVQLQGVRPVGDVRRGRYLVEGEVLALGLTVRLEGLKGPVLVDPGFSGTAAPAIHHKGHTATLLADGRVLVAGGAWGLQPQSGGEELYDPASRRWSAAESMLVARESHTATLLPDGRVLMTGGYGVRADSSLGELASAELYDPRTGTWSAAQPMATPRQQHSATLLPSGRVLVVGGHDGATPLDSAELYDPATGLWSPVGSLGTARSAHAATLLSDGTVLVTGGEDQLASLKSAERFDPGAGTFSPAGQMSIARKLHPALRVPGGKVLVTAGESTADVYDPQTGLWSAQTGLPGGRLGVNAALLLPKGRILTVASADPPFDDCSAIYYSQLDEYNPASASSAVAGWSIAQAVGHSLTLLPDGSALLVAGTYAELIYFPREGSLEEAARLGSARSRHTATLLATGQVLVAGGQGAQGSGGALASAERYDAVADRFDPVGAMSAPRSGHTATLLGSGQVLVAGGGEGQVAATAELYDPPTAAFLPTGGLGLERSNHTATLLGDGRVLLVGGESRRARHAELYDPATGSSCWTGALSEPRHDHSATLLPDGRVLIVGGRHRGTLLRSAELYDPATGSFAAAGELRDARAGHSAVLLERGLVRLQGGQAADGGGLFAEVYEPERGLWSIELAFSSPGVPGQRMSVLPSGWWLGTGRALLAVDDDVAFFDVQGTPARRYVGLPSVNVRIAFPRSFHTATLLRDGRVLLAGGEGVDGAPQDAVLRIDDSVVGAVAERPRLDSVSGLGAGGGSMVLSGAGLRGASGAGSGRGGSPTDSPVVTLIRVDDGQRFTTQMDHFEATQATVSVPPIPGGSYLVLATVNGVGGGYGPVAVAGAPTVLDCAAEPPLEPEPENDGGVDTSLGLSGCACDLTGQTRGGPGASGAWALALVFTLLGLSRGLRRRSSSRR